MEFIMKKRFFLSSIFMLTIIPVVFAAPQSCRWKQNGCDWLYTDTDGNNIGLYEKCCPDNNGTYTCSYWIGNGQCNNN